MFSVLFLKLPGTKSTGTKLTTCFPHALSINEGRQRNKMYQGESSVTHPKLDAYSLIEKFSFNFIISFLESQKNENGWGISSHFFFQCNHFRKIILQCQF